MSRFVFLVLAFASLSTANPCKDYTNKAFLSREWTITGTYLPSDVTYAFQNGFGPAVSNMAGFDEYVGANAVTSNSTPPISDIFFNVFDTADQASAAQAAAVAFVNNGALANQISRLGFYNGTVGFHFSSVCTNQSEATFFLARRLWSLQPVASMSLQNLSNYFRDNLAPTFSAMTGFHEYVSVILASNQLLFYNIFATADQSTAANAVAAQFVANSTLVSSQITKVAFSTSTIVFDLTGSTAAATTAAAPAAATTAAAAVPPPPAPISGASLLSAAHSLGFALFLLASLLFL